MCGHFSLYRNTPPLATLFTCHPRHRRIFQSPTHFVFDEQGITRLIRRLARQGALTVYWPTTLLNFADPPNNTPGRLGKLRNRWYWAAGKLYEIAEGAAGEKQEIMYLHFRTWKKSMRACYFRHAEEPPAFYISYSHIGLTTLDPSPRGASFLLYRTLMAEAARSILRRMRKLRRRTLGFFKTPTSTQR